MHTHDFQRSSGPVAFVSNCLRWGGRRSLAGVVAGLLGMAWLTGWGAAHGSAAETPAEITFARDVRPILSKHCYKCHGPDDEALRGGLRLDVRDRAVRPAESGQVAIVPGHPESSELVARIKSTDAGEVMPPPETKLPLSERDKLVLERWIAGGADYQPHWSLIAPQDRPLPVVKREAWVRNPIDRFILARLEAEGLAPNSEASRETLIRRLSLDLIGLPPTIAEIDNFVNDASPDAYVRLVDRLLASPHYGERWARRWLDLARYADTNGYEKDKPRVIWPYRDWVISALNRDLPFDQFTIEQLAGDMLPNATRDQIVATGFHRNTMLNEEGGIDPLEFRFHAMVDRVGTTSTVWMGLTFACAQCHNHKYDPLSQRDYYSLFAFLNNADEPEYALVDPANETRRAELRTQIAALEAELPNQFPIDETYDWQPLVPQAATAERGSVLTVGSEGAVLVSGPRPETDVYTLTYEVDLRETALVTLKALTAPSLGGGGPGRSDHGNFVLTELTATIAPKGDPASKTPLTFTATADFSQESFSAAGAVDGNPTTGWAIHGPAPWNVNRTLSLTPTAESLAAIAALAPGPVTLTIRLEQSFGTHHLLGKFAVALARKIPAEKSLAERRREARDVALARWTEQESARTVRWEPLTPSKATGSLPLLTILDDGSVLATGDQSKRDLYDLDFAGDFRGVTAFRIEAIPDDRLPQRGPGNIYYEGPIGDFFLSEVKLTADGQSIGLKDASETFASGASSAAKSIDGDPLSGWSINGAQGRWHAAVFRFEKPLEASATLQLNLLFERYYACGLGRFRISVTRDAAPATARDFAEEAELALATPKAERSPAQQTAILRAFILHAPEMAAARMPIDALRGQMPRDTTSLVMRERPASNPRVTHLHHRGEFLQPKGVVPAALPGALQRPDQPALQSRLDLARWLVSPQNPLVGRVTMNRQWAAFFAKGLVRTTEDFGLQGELPSHPELLDWLALELIRQQWSMKAMHRLIVTSATYRQASQVTPSLMEKDPTNRWLARFPRSRVEGEMVRDIALKISGQLSPKIGGPSVFPPQPAGVATEGAYGSLNWAVSTGEDRYRRGMYTFAKRTAPYAMFGTFDAPSGEACVPRRDISNTPLQALTLLNDAVFLEVAQSLGDEFGRQAGSIDDRITLLFRRAVSRPPTTEELTALCGFLESKLAQFQSGQSDPGPLVAPAPGPTDTPELLRDRAAWTLLARVLLNLDETITKE
jgi:hypothetical protein